MKNFLNRHGGFLILIVGFFSLGLWLFGHYLWGVSIAVRSTGWPSTSGEIISSKVCESYGKTGTSYYPCLQYNYSVNGKVFVGDQITGAHIAPGFREDAARMAQSYALGDKVKVFYDPGAPGTACLEPGVIPWETYGAIATGLFLILFSFYLLKRGLTDHKAVIHRPQK